MTSIQDRTKINKPNSFEYIGNLTIRQKLLAKDFPYSLCLNIPVMTVVTVNKVQDQYKTPVYNLVKDKTEQATVNDCLTN